MLAGLPRAGLIYESFVPDRHHGDTRSMVRTRLGRVRDAARHGNKVHAMPARYGHESPVRDISSLRGMQWLRQLDLSGADRMSLDTHPEDAVMASGDAGRIEAEMARIVSSDDRARLLMTVPGMNFVTALAIMAEVVDVGRFRTAEKFAAGGGVIPSRRNSASTYRGGGIAKGGSGWMRNAMPRPLPLRYGTTRGRGRCTPESRSGAGRAKQRSRWRAACLR